MMNEILRDIINKGKIAAFVDNVLVGTETEEGYDEVVEEVLRRLEENDFYVVQLILVTGIKPTVPLSAIDKENLLESSLY